MILDKCASGGMWPAKPGGISSPTSPDGISTSRLYEKHTRYSHHHIRSVVAPNYNYDSLICLSHPS